MPTPAPLPVPEPEDDEEKRRREQAQLIMSCMFAQLSDYAMRWRSHLPERIDCTNLLDALALVHRFAAARPDWTERVVATALGRDAKIEAGATAIIEATQRREMASHRLRQAMEKHCAEEDIREGLRVERIIDWGEMLLLDVLHDLGHERWRAEQLENDLAEAAHGLEEALAERDAARKAGDAAVFLVERTEKRLKVAELAVARAAELRHRWQLSIAEQHDWLIRFSLALGLADEVTGEANHDATVERLAIAAERIRTKGDRDAARLTRIRRYVDSFTSGHRNADALAKQIVDVLNLSDEDMDLPF